MKKTNLKGFLTLSLAALLALSLCACGGEPADSDQPDDSQQVEDVEQGDKTPTAPAADTPVAVDKEAYTLALPEGFTTQDAADGGVTILDKDGKEVGGVMVVECKGAENLKVSSEEDLNSDGYAVLAEQVAPEQKGSFAMSDYGLFRYTAGDTAHTFFPKGDYLYDLWLTEKGLSAEETSGVLGSFAAK
ncbi:MAG: hypothetical protein HFF00_08215 [Ruminiclostridium sp.]|jgi:hypothetical protein|nr:hypothetical protein [Ruminiclostridium sp.]